jgi:hypothetical protein
MRSEIGKLRIESESSLRFLYSLIAFNEAMTSSETVNKINKNPDFWRLFEASMFSNVFIAIRRLYEKRPSYFCIQRFTENCIANVEEFSLSSIRDRKFREGALSYEEASRYISNKYEPSEEDFKEMSAFIRSRSKNMKGIYSDVASTVYAHAIHFSHSEVLSANQTLNLHEIERALLSVWHVYEQVWQLYENGRKPTYDVEPSYQYKEEVIGGVMAQINA